MLYIIKLFYLSGIKYITCIYKELKIEKEQLIPNEAMQFEKCPA